MARGRLLVRANNGAVLSIETRANINERCVRVLDAASSESRKKTRCRTSRPTGVSGEKVNESGNIVPVGRSGNREARARIREIVEAA